MSALTRKLRELRHEVEHLHRRALRQTRRVEPRGEGQVHHKVRQEYKAMAVAKRVAGLETALAGGR